MLFRRKKPASFGERIRVALWPRRTWARSAKYVTKRILRLTASPHAISAGVAAGVFASFTPYLGFHFLIAFFVAYIIAGNFLAAAMGTFFGNPLSFPFIWASTYNLGNYVLSGEKPAGDGAGELKQLADAQVFDIGFSGLWRMFTGIWEPVLKPMTLGGVMLGSVFALVAYVLTRIASQYFHRARAASRERRARMIENARKKSGNKANSSVGNVT